MASLSRVYVLNKLRNQTLKIEGLHASFGKWPFKVNPHVDQARLEVRSMLKRCYLHNLFSITKHRANPGI